MEGNISSAQLNNQLLFASGLNSRTAVCDGSKLIAIGRLSFLPLSEHLQLHISQCIEQQQTSNCAELQESVNITVLLKGKIKFRVANKYYCFEVIDKPIAFANIVAQPEPFTRYIHSNQEVEKLTVSVSKAWVNARLQQQTDALFTSTKVVELPLSDKAIELTQQLMRTPSNPSLDQQLECEGSATQWLSCFFSYLVANNQARHAIYRLPPHSDIELRKNKIIDLLNHDKSVEQVSQELAMSVSSLQRFFKRWFNTTPKQYVKQNRLNKARHALLVEGLSIGEAAYLANYDHTANFIAAFKKQFGVTPMQFVKTHQHDTQVT
ncbi:helix-turn-helix domain-containing protein [Pseudoalteromonas sp. S16_S37]|uniref:helix-turn-helix domain-containing protein n=1 Tax=Pseudoalteromonas sp. S16_S37 TaxID=2720228 RepID=UPI0016801C36|nr:AraC family transcriptional regulator [Pseudoalteromonas sp. S16_S37]MBD1583971.1 helix-turn-helix transcriptional regulator [Pseudoalteromonas sp. S16_S37]